MCAINKIIKQCICTFKCVCKNGYQSNFEKLVTLTQNLNANDVGLLPEGNDLTIYSSPPLLAPVCHISVYESSEFTLGIFIVRKGMKIPLHDHPGMTGIVKVIYGSMKVTSYESANGNLSLDEHFSLDKLPVTKYPDVVLTPSSGCHVLTPHVKNFHIVQSVDDGDAAMFDILSPPYSDERDCHYFKEVLQHYENEFNSSLGEESTQHCLVHIPQPFTFYCDSLPYEGPAILPELEEEDV